MRYKEFNRIRVLDKCILLFWDNGFRGSAISRIVETTRVNRFSLYSEFEDKEGILYAALRQYQTKTANPMLSGLNSLNGDVITQIQSVYRSFFELPENHPPGCFIIHIATELADENAIVKEILTEYVDMIESKLLRLLKEDGRSEEDASFLAKHLVALFCTSMCFSLLQSPQERIEFVENGVQLIFDQKVHHA